MALHTGVAERGEEWFERLYRSHHAAVRAYARRRLDDPDDVVAEVFAVAWRSRNRVPDPPLPWLYRTAHNQVLHAYRAQGRRRRLTDRLTAAAGGPGPANPAQLDTSSPAAMALQRLSSGDQELLCLLAWEELTHPQIAYVLGCSATALRVRLHRARTRFAAHFDDLTAPVGTRTSAIRPSTEELKP